MSVKYVCDWCDKATCTRIIKEENLTDEEKEIPALKPDCCPMDGEKVDWRRIDDLPNLR